MELHNKLKKIICIGISTLVLYSSNSLAQEFLNTIEENIVGTNETESRNFQYSFQTSFLTGKIQSRLNEDFTNGIANINLNLKDTSRFTIDLDSTNVKSCRIANQTSFFHGKANLENRLFFGENFELASYQVQLQNPFINLFAKTFTQETKKGNIFFAQTTPLFYTSIKYGTSNLANRKPLQFNQIKFSRENIKLSISQTLQHDLAFKSAITHSQYAVFAEHFPKNTQIIFAYHPIITDVDLEIYDEPTFKNKGTLKSKSLKPLRSFTNKGFALKYSQYKTTSTLRGAWNFLTLTKKLDSDNLKTSLWLDFKYDNLSNLTESISGTITYNNFAFSGNYNTNGDTQVTFEYNIKF